jgi:hypothetical protein
MKWAGRTALKRATVQRETGHLYRSEAGHLGGACLGRTGQFIERSARSSVECGSASLAKALAGEIDAVGVVNYTVQDRVSERGIADDFVPAVHGNLAGDEDGAAVVAIFDDLEQVSAAIGAERFWSPVVDDEQIGARQRAASWDSGHHFYPASAWRTAGTRDDRVPRDPHDRPSGQAHRRGSSCPRRKAP